MPLVSGETLQLLMLSMWITWDSLGEKVCKETGHVWYPEAIKQECVNRSESENGKGDSEKNTQRKRKIETNKRTRAVLSLGYDKLFTMCKTPGMKANQIKKITCQLKLSCLVSNFNDRIGGDKIMCFKDKSYGVAQPGLLWFNRQTSSQIIICRLSFASAEISAVPPPHMARTHFCICTKHHEIGANGSLPEERGEECSLREIWVCMYTQTHTYIYVYISVLVRLYHFHEHERQFSYKQKRIIWLFQLW